MVLNDQVVVVTGGGRGIGRAVALACAKAGGHVSVLGRTESALEEVANEIRELNKKALPIRCDVSNPSDVDEAIQQTRHELGPIDVLVNNAGIAQSAPVAKTSDELWQKTMDINLSGTFYGIRAVLKEMMSRKQGRIINIASIAGKIGFLYTSAYCASKAAVIGLTRAVAMEGAPHGVTVNAVCPGWVETDMAVRAISNIANKTELSEEKARATLEQMSPQNRMITVQEVADLVVFLSSEAARGINGQALNVDGGEIQV